MAVNRGSSIGPRGHGPDQTRDLLEGIHQGDDGAMEIFLTEHLPYIRRIISSRMGPDLRREFDSGDIVQEVVLKVLRQGPHFLVDRADFLRALVARIAINFLNDRYRAKTRRRQNGEISVVDLDPIDKNIGPATAVARNENEALLDLALELLSRADREMIELRQFQGLSFEEVAQRFDIDKDAARMRFNRSLRRLAKKARELKTSGLPSVWEI